MMRTATFLLTVVLTSVFCASASGAEGDGLVAWWKFDEGHGTTAFDSATGEEDSIRRHFWYLPGVAGTAVKFDGYTTHIVREASRAPLLSYELTIEAWVAPQAYPWNWCAVVNQEQDRQTGYFFGIDYEGRVGLHLSLDEMWHEYATEEQIPFMKWSHIAATFDRRTGAALYINGRESTRSRVRGTPVFARDVPLQIGRNLTPLPPAGLTRPHVRFPAPYSFDGIIDELKIYDRALSAQEIVGIYEATKPNSAPPLEWRKLPRLPDGGGVFGAFYTRLAFYPEWDALWRVSSHPDIVVSFDDSDCKMVFWRGTNYNMNLVTENGKWVGDQSAEGGGGKVVGCCEHMSDKQCRYAYVRIIENHEARVVVHWRYALCDVLYRIANLDDGWGAWADEYYYIYPDATAVRHFTVYNVRGCSITEPTVFSPPGTKPEDNVSLEATVTLANPAGETRTYGFETWPSSGRSGAPFTNALPNANMTVVNLKSEYNPFYVYEPGTRIIPYGGGTKEVFYEYSHFHAKNHWPTCLMPTDGRRAWAPDRVTSSAITSPEPPMERREENNALVGRFIMGLTKKSAEELAGIARSWLHPPAVGINGSDFTSQGYSRDQRAYLFTKHGSSIAPLEFELVASHDLPVVNPVLVIENWGDIGAALRINGEPVRRGESFRFGHRHTLQGTDLVVWIRVEVEKPISIRVSPVTDR